MSGKRTDPIPRFWTKVDTTGECWTWTAAAANGYGRFFLDGRNHQAHHVAWMLSGGRDLAHDEVIDHVCHTKLCVRPSHLQVMTMADNSRRGRSATARARAALSDPTTWRARFLASIETAPSGCHLWTGSLRNGYGRFQADGTTHLAHRVAWALAHGSTPDDKVLDHLCGVRTCVNVDHLEPVDYRENVRRGNRRAPLTSCVHGHAYDEANTYIAPDGRRSCKACRDIHQRNRRADKQKEKAA